MTQSPTESAGTAPSGKALHRRAPWLRTEVVLLTIVLGLLVWLAGSVLLLIFAGVLLAVALDGLSRPLLSYERLPRSLAILAVLAIIATLAVFGTRTIAPRFLNQFGELWDQLAEFLVSAQEWLQEYPWMQQLVGPLAPGVNDNGADLGGVMGSVATATVTVLGATASIVLVIVIALFAATDPGLYQRGLIRLVPFHKRARISETLIQLGYALRWWLLGQLVSMTVLGVSTAIGLYLLGVELWLGLGVLVGILTFVPFLGPIVAGIPVVLISFTEGFETGIAVLIFYLILQNLEGNFITPLIQKRAISLPPVMLIAMQVLLGTLFGVAGLILAAPLAVVTMVSVDMLYVQDVLGDRPAKDADHG